MSAAHCLPLLIVVVCLRLLRRLKSRLYTHGFRVASSHPTNQPVSDPAMLTFVPAHCGALPTIVSRTMTAALPGSAIG